MRRNAGFTLIVILIVAAIIGVMLAAAVVSVSSGRSAAHARTAARGVAQMSHYANARKRVTDGTSIYGPLAASGAFPRMMTDMLAVGEQAGNMAESLDHIGMRYQKDMDRNITAFTNALEPILIVLIAGAVGFVAVAILMAVFNMSKALG